MPSFSFSEDQPAYGHGSVLRNVRTEPREIDLHLLVFGTNETDLRNNIRSVLKMFNPIGSSHGTLTVETSGSKRSLHCRYAGGMEGERTKDTTSTTFQRLAITLRAFDPFWEDYSPKTFTYWAVENQVKWFPFFPLQLGTDGTSMEVNVTNDGDIETFPTWTIYGPCDAPKIYLTDGRYLTFTYLTLDNGEILYIDTANRTIQKNNGTNVFSKLDWGSSFGGLLVGSNRIRIEMTNITGNTKVELTFKQKYLGA
jgi:hypothetical protein